MSMCHLDAQNPLMQSTQKGDFSCPQEKEGRSMERRVKAKRRREMNKWLQ